MDEEELRRLLLAAQEQINSALAELREQILKQNMSLNFKVLATQFALLALVKKHPDPNSVVREFDLSLEHAKVDGLFRDYPEDILQRSEKAFAELRSSLLEVARQDDGHSS
jgi:hypothetical protein